MSINGDFRMSALLFCLYEPSIQLWIPAGKQTCHTAGARVSRHNLSTSYANTFGAFFILLPSFSKFRLQ